MKFAKPRQSRLDVVVLLDDSHLIVKRVHVPDKIILSGFAQDNPIETVGRFLETEKESGLPVAMQHVYVKKAEKEEKAT